MGVSRSVLLGGVVAIIIAVSIISGVELLPSNTTGAASFSLVSHGGSTMNATTTPPVTFGNSSSSSTSMQLPPVQTNGSFSSTTSANETLSNGEITRSSSEATGSTNWLLNETFTTTSATQDPIFCSGGGTTSGSTGAENTVCNELIDNNPNDTITVASYHLNVSGMNDPRWEFSVGIVTGQNSGNYTWNFGDGKNGSSVSDETITHTYVAPGIYEATTNLVMASPISNSSSWRVGVAIAIYVHVSSHQISTATRNMTHLVLNSTDGSSVCSLLFDGAVGTGGWNSGTNTCTLSGDPILSPTFLMNQSATLTIGHDATLVLSNPGHGFANYGTIINNGILIFENVFIDYGTVINNGKITIESPGFEIQFAQGGNDPGVVNNSGTIENMASAAITNQGTINNNGSIDNLRGAAIYNYFLSSNFSGIINNYLTINNQGSIENERTINNFGTLSNAGSITNLCKGVITGNPVLNNPVQTQGC